MSESSILSLDKTSNDQELKTDNKQLNLFTARHPMYGKYVHLRGRVFILEGLIGAGKTTAGQSCAKYLNEIGLCARFYPEYNNKQLLKQYIENMAKYAYTFQLLMQAQRINIYHRAANFARTGGIAIIDRSIIGDYTFAQMLRSKGFLTQDEFAIYENIFEQADIPTPDGIIYLDCSAEQAFNRTIKRASAAESSYDLAYFRDLQQAYNSILHKITQPLIKIDWSTSRQLVNKALLEKDIHIILHALLQLY